MSTAPERSALLVQRKKLSESLRTLRCELAAKMKTSVMQVFQNATLAEIVIQLPKTKEALLKIKGISATKYALFGEEVLEVVRMYSSIKAPNEMEKVIFATKESNIKNSKVPVTTS